MLVKFHPLPDKLIHDRGMKTAAMPTHILPAKVIRDDQENIGLVDFLPGQVIACEQKKYN